MCRCFGIEEEKIYAIGIGIQLFKIKMLIYTESFEAGQRVIRCIFTRERAVVYDLFLALRAEEFGN